MAIRCQPDDNQRQLRYNSRGLGDTRIFYAS